VEAGSKKVGEIMKTLTVTMPVITECKAEECAYNRNRLCHARAITIGDGKHPACDTYFCTSHSSEQHIMNKNIIAGIGACKVQSCQYNVDYECFGENISIAHNNGRIACMNYLTQ
jgi:hypothetical protein